MGVKLGLSSSGTLLGMLRRVSGLKKRGSNRRMNKTRREV
jgi:hypothetical protein